MIYFFVFIQSIGAFKEMQDFIFCPSMFAVESLMTNNVFLFAFHLVATLTSTHFL